MCSKLFYFIVLYLFLSLKGRDAKPAQRIIGGTDARIEEHPSIVVIHIYPVGITCAGTLITTRYVLTAAHCVTFGAADIHFRDLRYYYVVPGHDSLIGYNTFVPYGVEDIHVYNTWNGDDLSTSGGDIAIIKTVREVPVTDFQKPAQLPTGPIRDGLAGTMLGWGATNLNDCCISQHLKKVTTQTMDRESCKKSFEPFLAVDEFCTIGKQTAAFCTGDSGGPLFNNAGELIGIISHTTGCVDSANVFVDVFYYEAWISEVTTRGFSINSKIVPIIPHVG